jgi:dihydroflavonol-4-reductase
MEAALETGAEKVVHMSTALIYGKPLDAPFTEDSPVGPVRFSKYAESKYRGNLIAWKLSEEAGLPLVVLYPSGVLGPGDDKFTGQYIQMMMRGGMPARAWESAVHNLVHVNDVVESIYQALLKGDNVGEKYLISGYQVTLGQLNQMISEISGTPLPRLVFPDWLAMASAVALTTIADLLKKPPLWNMMLDGMRNLQAGIDFDGSKAERELGITYTPIREAVQDAIESYK